MRPEAAPTMAAIDSLVATALLRSLEPAILALDRMLDEGTPAEDLGGDPDGYDGIDRTGDLEHLLASEWLMVGEEPDEFVRRYSQRELSFLKRAQTSRKRARTTLVLFDSGPDQLGAPRLVHLACLVALARRAAEAGSELHWGTLQNDARYVLRTPEDLRRLVESRTAVGPPTHPPVDALLDDCLVVSPTEFGVVRQLLLRGASDSVEAVLVDRRRASRRRGVIPLPPPAASIRLLRDPTGLISGPAHRSPATMAPTSNLVFDHAGNKVLARAGTGGAVVMFPAPNSVNLPDQRARLVGGLSTFGPAAAAGRISRALITATFVDGGTAVVVNRVGGARGQRIPEGRIRLSEPVPSTVAGDPLGTVRKMGETLQIRVADRLLVHGDGVMRVGPDEEGRRWGSPPFEVVLSAAGSGQMVRSGTEQWFVRGVEGTRVLAAVRSPDHGGIQLLQIEDDRQIVAVGTTGADRSVIGRSETAIVDATVHHQKPVLAYRTVDGRVKVLSWRTGQLLFSWEPDPFGADLAGGR
jgi:hypothetical protein